MKKLIIVLIVLNIFNILLFNVVLAESDIKVLFNNQPVDFDAKPYEKDGRTLVPFRKILEAFGTEVSWDESQQIISATKRDAEIYLKIGVNYAYVNGSKVQLDVPPEITEDRTFVPLRFISENMGAEVNWDALSNTVGITYNDTVYRLGETGAYKDLKFRINKVDKQEIPGKLKITGEVNSNTKDLLIEVSDDYGYVLPATMTISSKNGDMYSMETTLDVPTCHDFEATYIVLKTTNDTQKVIKIGDYTLY